MANKICNKCKINKQAEDFSVDKRSPHGLLQSWCRACVSDSSKIRSKKLVAEARLAREVAREELDKIKIEEKRVAIEKKRLKIEEARVLRNKKHCNALKNMGKREISTVRAGSYRPDSVGVGW